MLLVKSQYLKFVAESWHKLFLETGNPTKYRSAKIRVETFRYLLSTIKKLYHC